MRQGFIEQAHFHISRTEVVFGNAFVRRNLKGMSKERQAVIPVADLNVGKGRIQAQHHRREGELGFARESKPRCEISDGPYRHDEQAEQRNVGVAIGHGLAPNLDDTDDRNERAQVPEPAGGQVFKLTFTPDQCADEQNHERSGNHFPRRQAPWKVIAAALVILLISALVWRERKFKYLPAGWLWYLGTLVPVIGIIQVGRQAMADRYAYISLLGLFVMAVWSIADFAPRLLLLPESQFALSAMVRCLYAAFSYVQIGYWHGDLRLFFYCFSVSPG